MSAKMYVAIEGVIGVGKTTLARLLQPSFEAKLILEAFEENPFLSDFYGDRDRYAFQTQIFFLLSRYRQQMQNVNSVIGKANIISDYTFEKDALFAELNLHGDELRTYHLVYQALSEQIHPPDLIVYLRANTEVAMQRIAMRDRSYERNMDFSYIDDLNEAYEVLFRSKREPQILSIDTNPLDFVTHHDHLEKISNRIRAALGIPPFQTEFPFQEG
jgi:deoxyguanosine kinase